MRKYLVAVLAVLGVATSAPAAKADFGVRVGILTCDVAGGAGLIVGSRKPLACYFNALGSADEAYEGAITKIGLDAGITTGSKIAWAVFAPTTQLSPGALEGRYYGVSAEATWALGLGANILIGGFDRSINLQPLSVQGQAGANIAGGIGYMRLKSPPPVEVYYKK
ncbi:DUF992 domain-containing protein [Acuticoccus sp. I52.16.1]|uniref:DUF992 domain-containing protein n=1 Tax=Acuticoccus sp. I52.16.1 TaxID=2928472 RepID=UPI001FD40485|nr:DUF992 domain-containing protein [Acuticoccus sp. I52.16.1]UOM36529.1 DUF992 domain-containing protein [Acuticoccus sp. I52.16.1]